jgi:hypothetical protein
MVLLTDTSDCRGWRNEPRRLVPASQFSVELAEALKSKSRSPPGLLIVQAQLANIAAHLNDQVRLSAHPKEAEHSIVRAESLGNPTPSRTNTNQLKRLVKFLSAAKGRRFDFNCMTVVIPRGDIRLTITGKPTKSDTVAKTFTLQSRRANEDQELVLAPSMHSSVEASSRIRPLT